MSPLGIFWLVFGLCATVVIGVAAYITERMWSKPETAEVYFDTFQVWFGQMGVAGSLALLAFLVYVLVYKPVDELQLLIKNSLEKIEKTVLFIKQKLEDLLNPTESTIDGKKLPAISKAIQSIKSIFKNKGLGSLFSMITSPNTSK